LRDTLAPGVFVRSSSTGIAGAQEHGRISTCAIARLAIG
jgi:hypothetical protein